MGLNTLKTKGGAPEKTEAAWKPFELLRSSPIGDKSGQLRASRRYVKTRVHSQEWLCHEAQLCGPAIDPNRAHIYFTPTVNRNVIC